MSPPTLQQMWSPASLNQLKKITTRFLADTNTFILILDFADKLTYLFQLKFGGIVFAKSAVEEISKAFNITITVAALEQMFNKVFGPQVEKKMKKVGSRSLGKDTRIKRYPF